MLRLDPNPIVGTEERGLNRSNPETAPIISSMSETRRREEQRMDERLN